MTKRFAAARAGPNRARDACPLRNPVAIDLCVWKEDLSKFYIPPKHIQQKACKKSDYCNRNKSRDPHTGFRSADFNASSLTPITAPNIRFEKLPEMEHKPIEDEGRYGAVCTVTLNNDDTDR